MERMTQRGLAGVEADDTALSRVEGDVGRLSYRGYDVEALVERPLEDVVQLLMTGELPTRDEASAFTAWCREVTSLTDRDRTLLRHLNATGAPPITCIQAALPLLDDTGQDAPLPDFDEHAGLRLALRTAPALAAILGREDPSGVDAPDHCSRQLTSMLGRAASDAERRAFSVLQILQLDHGFNAGTFTARVVASTRAGTAEALAAAIGALSGVLHGGADQAALADAREVGHPDRAAAFVDACLATGRRVMGMGHREYRVLDPRARLVRGIAADLAEGSGTRALFETLTAIEDRFAARMAERGKSLHANLEFYKSIPYLACGIPENAFTATFATARIFGWVAHVAEARASGTIIRPAARWVGAEARDVA